MSVTPAPPNTIVSSKPRRNGIRSREPKGTSENMKRRTDVTAGKIRASDQLRSINGAGIKPGDDENPEDGEKQARTLWSRVQSGRSFVDDEGQVSPWMFASDPHGTQMANLICAIDPLCKLYITKVTDSNKYGITPQRVAKAIVWAVDNDVDIISMSFSIVETTNKFDAVIIQAHSRGIILMCSSHDEGVVAPKSFPASYDETLTIAACDEYGALLREVKDKNGFKYKLNALNIAAGSVPFLNSSERISGSSVTTAIASGLSSLILSCVSLNNPGWEQSIPDHSNQKEQGKVFRRKVVQKYLQAIVVPGSDCYLSLEKFRNINVRFQDGQLIKAQTVLEHAFTKFHVDHAINNTEGLTF
uniref:Serine protease n=2 Tax=Podospora anserina (strain S / ATCC MYA-4624 / DSM 980 / FGSC 10383) TaxID=515849 RepID=A0A090CRL9_PODAN|nr:Putative serine protease [Podospora anserina S mat+]